jgi:HdeA/HdeB family
LCTRRLAARSCDAYDGFSVALSQQTPSPEALSELSTPKEFDLTKITCGDFLNLSLTDRGHLLMMYWGFTAAKSGTTKFVTADIRARAMKLNDFCATSPQTPMMTAVGKFVS